MAERLTIGAFARLAELTPKALRLYDELGLLRPAQVDPDSGYRYYEQAQLEQARLVAWLRLLGMPLARIATVRALPPAAAAAEVAAYWAQVEHDTESRRGLARFLVDRLNGKGSREMTTDTITAGFGAGCAAASDTGLVRDGNQDSAYAGPGVLAVADGFGPEGARAGALALEALKAPVADVAEGMAAANRAIGALDASGATLTALLWRGTELTLVHVGDSRAYLLRDGELLRLTTDHSMVRTLVDEGRLTEAEAEVHPQRALLTRALDGREDSGADLSVRQARAGDRYLLCTDGLSAVVREADIRETLLAADTPDTAVRELVALARAAGGPDNIGVAVGDIE